MYPSRRQFRISLMDVHDQVRRRIATHEAHEIEAMSLAALAMRQAFPSLVAAQLGSGAWRPYVDQGPSSVFHTSLALLALRRAGHVVGGGIDRAFSWLESVRGVESHWFWRWKFRLVDRAVTFDPLKTGWPWFEGTISWVAPTAMAILACRAFSRKFARSVVAEGMLLDRACLAGGWNAGNSVVMGVPLDPHPDFTAMTLLALGKSQSHAQIPQAHDYLASRAESLSSAYSLAWAVMALAVHRPDAVPELQNRLRTRLATRDELPLRTLALCALALEEPAFDWSIPGQ